MAQSIASRSRRTQQAQPDDVVLARALQISEWARRNLKILLGTAAVVLVLVVGFLWYRWDNIRRADEAALAFLQVEQSVMAGTEAVAQRELELFIQRHGSTTYGDEARVLLSQLHLTGGRAAEAVEAVRPVADRIDGSPVGAQAGLLLATAQEAAGDTAGAVQTYLRVAAEAEMQFQRQDALATAALLRQESGDHAGAAQLYARLVQTVEPGSPDRFFFEMRLAEAEALAAAQ